MNREEQIRNANPYSGSSDIGFGKMCGFNAGAEWADENPVSSPWISVEERTPEHDNGQSLCEVLVKTNDGRYSVTVNICVEDMAERGEVTHWCPIPE